MALLTLAQGTGILVALFLLSVSVAADSAFIMSLGSLAAGGIGGYHLWLILSRRTTHWSFCDLHGAALLISYFGGAVVTIWFAEEYVVEFLVVRQLNNLFLAAIFILAFYLALRLCGVWERRHWAPVWEAESRRSSWPVVISGMLAVLGVLQVIFLILGDIGFGGVRFIAEANKVPYLESAIVAMSWPVVGICAWVFGRAELRRQGRLFATCVALMPIQFIFTIG